MVQQNETCLGRHTCAVPADHVSEIKKTTKLILL